LAARSAAVLGQVDGIFGAEGVQQIQGWACQPSNPNPLTVEVYTGGGRGVGQLYGAYTANASPDDAGVSSACGTTTGHRFVIDITGDLFARARQKIFVYGIAESGGAEQELVGSGRYSTPASTTFGLLQVIDAGGYAEGWAFDYLNPGASVDVVIYADGDSALGAETGRRVWEGVAEEALPKVDEAYGITGNHGFSVQLPSSVTQGVHDLSMYAVNIHGEVGAPLQQSPAVPGATALPTHLALATSAEGFPTKWLGYTLPKGQLQLVGLSGTVTLGNTADIFSEILFIVTYLPSGACPTQGNNTSNGPPGLGPTVWSDIIKAPTTGNFTAPVNFTLPVGIPISNCLVVGLGGGTVAGEHRVTGAIDLVATYMAGPASSQSSSAQILGLDSEFCFGQDWGCQGATTNDTQSFAAVTQITQRSSLDVIWGNISDSTFDGSSSFGPLPTGPWTASNDVYLYPAADCTQFPADRSYNGPGDYYARVPTGARHLLSAPLSGAGGAGAGATINSLLPGLTNGIAIYQTYSDIALEPGECLVSLYGVQHTTGAFDNEDQLHAIVTPF